jgi:hypothetical protein
VNRFERDTAVRRAGEGRYAARLDRGWWITRGPNGGYVAAIVLRALIGAVSDPARRPRSLTLHYTSPPAVGEVEVRTRIERKGRGLTTATARLVQGEKLRAIAVGAFGLDRPGPTFGLRTMPEVPPPERSLPLAKALGAADVPIRDRYESLLAVGPPLAPSNEAVSGGWIRLREDPGPIDAPLVAAYTDAWPPAVFTQRERLALSRGVPTVELTVHFRAPYPEGADPRDFVLVVFRAYTLRDGFVEEDGEVWTHGGVLLAQSRQLAVLG